jgi:conserved oligomeric Golgi complex subunit 4
LITDTDIAGGIFLWTMESRDDETALIGQNGDDSKSVYCASSVAEIHGTLHELQKKEALVTSQLNKLLTSQKDLQRELGRLDLFRANLSTQSSKIRAISNGMISDTSVTANRISSSVKSLDLEQSRVKATLNVVEQVSELKACILGVAGSMGAAQNWETAASYINRASKIPSEIVNGQFAARTVPTAEVPEAPNVTLENASESLCGLFLREFDKAVKESDGGRITRFFKLFPLINRSEVGLDVYGRYVCQGVAARSRTNLNAGTGGNQSKDGFFFANALTKLFEHIAHIIEGHGGLVERHYGPGSMTRVIERLHIEADMQGGIILDTWADDRRIDRHLTDVRSYAYTFLVQSFLPNQRGSVGTPRSNSPAKRISEDEGVDMKQIDALLNEMTLMLGKWSLYIHFVADKCKLPTAMSPISNDLPSFILNSSLMRKINDRLIQPFNTMTTFFFRRSVEKAFQLDEQPLGLSLNPHKPINSNPPHASSAIDDIMYIVNKVLQQSLATSQLAIALSVVPTVARVMGSDFLGMIQRKMRDESYPKAAIQGALPPEHTIVSFLVLVNNLDVSMDYIDQVLRTRIQSSTGVDSANILQTLFPTGGEAEIISNALKSFGTMFSEKTSGLLSEGVNVIFSNVMKPRLRPILMDAFRDTDYQPGSDDRELVLDDSLEAEDDTSELVRMRFQHGWDALTKPIGRIMTARTFDQLLTNVIPYLGKLLEKRLWTYHGRVNATGAIRLERDVNAVVNVVVQGRKYGYRDAFLKCIQMCMVMNMDDEEWETLQNEGGEIADKLTADERSRARNMVNEPETLNRI